jgi:hypothetical protein
LYSELDINGALKGNRKNNKISAKPSLADYELKKFKPWIDEGWSGLLDYWKMPNFSGYSTKAKEMGII